MKKILISMLAIATLASCSKSENVTNVNDGTLVPIRLGAGVSTKAPITTGSATVQIEGWETTTPADYIVASTWKSNASVTVAADAAAITLTPAQYYNANEATTTYIRGWYPQIASENGKVTIKNLGGTEDVLLSNAVSGNKKSPVATDMKFDHQTAQLIFNVVKGEGLATDTKITSINVKNAYIPTSIDLMVGAVEYSSKTPLVVPNVTEAVIGTAAVAGEPLMIQPVGDNTTLKLDIVTSTATYTDVTFTTEGNKIEMGKAYTITLTFNQATISIKAHITDWVPAIGSGSVQ